jgi:Tol biopolymer transport system component
VLPVPSGTPRRAFGLAQGVYPFSWMQDGRGVVFGGALPGTFGTDLHVADIASGALSALTVTTRDALSPSISPDGASIAFAVQDSDANLIEIPLDGSPVRPLPATGRNESDPTWMHRSDQLAYATDRTGASELWLKSFREGWERPLVTAREFPGAWVLALNEPSFSPDDQRLAYSMLGSEGHAIYVSNVRGGPPLRLLAEKGEQRSPTWNPDGEWIAYLEFAAGRWRLAKARSGGGDRSTVLHEDAVLGHPKWSRASQWITCVTREGLLVVRPDGSDKRLISRSQWLVHGWDSEGRIHGIRRAAGGGRELASVDVERGIEKSVSPLGLPAHAVIGCYSMHPEGGRFAVSVMSPKSDIWLLKGYPRPRSFWRRLLPWPA